VQQAIAIVICVRNFCAAIARENLLARKLISSAHGFVRALRGSKQF